MWPVDVGMWEITVGRLQRYQCVHGNFVRNLSDVILLPRGGLPPCGKTGLLGHNSPFNDVFPWLPVSCLKDEQSFISGSRRVNYNLFWLGLDGKTISCMRNSITLCQFELFNWNEMKSYPLPPLRWSEHMKKDVFLLRHCSFGRI